MRKNVTTYRQGEIMFFPMSQLTNDEIKVLLPKNVKLAKIKPVDNQLIVGHSETGHHHVIELDKPDAAQLLIDEVNRLCGQLTITKETEVKHLRTYDTHEVTILPKDDYIIRYRAEDTPEGWKRVQD